MLPHNDNLFRFSDDVLYEKLKSKVVMLEFTTFVLHTLMLFTNDMFRFLINNWSKSNVILVYSLSLSKAKCNFGTSTYLIVSAALHALIENVIPSSNHSFFRHREPFPFLNVIFFHGCASRRSCGVCVLCM